MIELVDTYLIPYLIAFSSALHRELPIVYILKDASEIMNRNWLIHHIPHNSTIARGVGTLRWDTQYPRRVNECLANYELQKIKILHIYKQQGLLK